MEDVKTRFLEQGIERWKARSRSSGPIFRKEQQRWGRVIKDANIPPNL